MHEAYRTEEEQRYAKPANEALAGVTDQAMLENDLELWPPETERQRKTLAGIYRIWSLGRVNTV